MKPHPSHAAIAYRPEVDGLRALAVLPVILFHAGVKGFDGGFVGVDVFFVISGYLITSIIAGDCRAGRFSLASFYERRARRILPALFVVVAACIPFALAWMLPAELERFGRSLLATLAFVPNVYFWRATNYFSPSAEEEPLLHTWSLGVEEQFYVVFPLLVWATWRRGLGTVAAMTLVLALASFGLSEWLLRIGRVASNFYLPASRAWELMIGAMLALAWQTRPVYERAGLLACNLLSGLGLALLAGSIVLFDKHVPTPSVYALAPTVGTALIIAFTRPGTLVHGLLSHRWLVGVGLVSYSAYLWHQPLMAYARLRGGAGQGGGLVLAMAGLTMVLAYLSWRYVESPFRSGRTVGLRTLVRTALASAGVLAAFGVAAELTNGLESRLPAADRGLAAMVNSTEQGHYVTTRFHAMTADFDAAAPRPRVLVVGDSYAQDFVNAAVESGGLAAPQMRTYYVSSDCQIYYGPEDVTSLLLPLHRETCREMRDPSGLLRRAAQADVVVLAAFWRPWSAQRLPDTIKQLALRPDQRLVIVGPKRVGDVRVRELLQLTPAQRLALRQPVLPAIAALEQTLEGVAPPGSYVSMQAAVCGGSRSACGLFTPQGELVSFDGTHLTRPGALMAGRALFAAPPLAGLATAAPRP